MNRVEKLPVLPIKKDHLHCFLAGALRGLSMCKYMLYHIDAAAGVEVAPAFSLLKNPTSMYFISWDITQQVHR